MPANIKFFEHMNQNQIKKIKSIGELRHLEKNRTLFLEGDESIGFFFILDGSVKVLKNTIDGRERIISLLNKESMVGLIPVLTNQPFQATAVTVTDSEFLFFPKGKFMNLVSSDADISKTLITVLSARMKDCIDLIMLLANPKVVTRIASYIIELTKEQNNKEVVSLNISKKNIAKSIGIRPETLSRIFSKMIDNKIIKMKEKKIKISDFKKLAELAEYT